MSDVLVLLIVGGFFALALAYVAWAERIVAHDRRGNQDGRR